MSHIVSPEQLAANRANAANSTGPRTPEGKTRSSQNASKHGFTASSFAVIRLEDLNEVANLREDLIAFYHPVNSQELFAVERIALAQQAILRAARLEAGFFSLCLGESFDCNGQIRMPMNSQLTEEIEISQAQNRNFLLGDGFHRLIRQNNGFALLLRYQAQAERQYRRAIEDFDRLKALRSELPNKPTHEAQPEAQPKQTETTCAACETNPSSPESSAPEPDPPAPVSELKLNPGGEPGVLEVPEVEGRLPEGPGPEGAPNRPAT
jgi:hypothetical protein